MTYQDYRNIILERRGHIGILTINRPNRRNSVDNETAMEFVKAIGELNGDDEVRAIVIRAEGDDFGTGEDITESAAFVPPEERGDQPIGFGCIFDILEDTYKPVTAAVQGRAIGGSYCMLYYCDTVVASEDARIQSGTINFGYTNIWRMRRMERCVGTKKAWEWIMSGDWIPAAELEKYGFVNKVVSREKLDEAAMEMAERFASKSPLAMQVSKEGWSQARDMSIKEGETYFLTLRKSNLWN